MTDTTEQGTTTPPNTEQEDSPVQLSEIEVLRQRADQLGLRYRSNTGVEKLRAMVNAAIQGLPPVTDDDEQSAQPNTVQGTTNVTDTPELSPNARRQQVRNEARRLVRVSVTCMNPAKSEWEGEMFTFGNAVVGTIKRYVPFEQEWHIEYALYEMMKARKYQQFYSITGPRGQKVRQAKLVNEFSITLLPALTPEELESLAQRQAMASGTLE